MKNKKKTILITGGAGFIGSHLCEKYLNEGYRVICVDNLQTGNLKNIERFLDNDDFSFVRHDIEKKYIPSEDIDLILNFACPASPKMYQEDPVKTVRTNVLGMINMLELAKEKNIKVLQASTSEVYGDPDVHPQKESYFGNVNPISKRACYDEGKRCAETLCFDYKREYGVNVQIIRIFNTYGPNMSVNDGRVVSNFIVQALNGDDITIYGDGSQTRSFMYVSDLVEAVFDMSKLDFSGPINIGNPNEITIFNLAKKIIELTNTKSKIVFKDLPDADPCRRNPDISLAKKILKWNPKVKLEDGLKKTIDYFRSVL